MNAARALAVPALLAAAACHVEATGVLPGVALVDAFPEHPRWRRPLALVPLAPGDARHVVVEQGGRVHVFDLAEDGSAGPPEPFLDLSPDVETLGNEEGLLGLAFHPDARSNGRLFVYYCVDGERRSRLSELLLDGDPRTARRADPGSERVLLEVAQPWRNHNGGGLLFGPDGMLYLSLGDGGAGGDRGNNAQDLATLLGSILRLDVDRRDPGLEYAIPPDNPFVREAGARGEIWAFGLRNAWRFAFDPESGRCWTGDVGQEAWEEIDVVRPGGNHGWPLREGRAPYRPRARDDVTGVLGPAELVAPVLAYPASEGRSVTGGVVARGDGVPPVLRGRYVFADYLSGQVWAFPADAARPEKELVARCDSVASFAVDAWGALYACSFDGRLYRFTAARAGAGGPP